MAYPVKVNNYFDKLCMSLNFDFHNKKLYSNIQLLLNVNVLKVLIKAIWVFFYLLF